FSTALLIRLLPVGSNLLTNLAAGVSGVRAVPFVAGSTLGYVPQTLIFALVGSGLHIEPALRIGASVVLFVVSGMLGVYLFRRYRGTSALIDAGGDAGADTGGPTS
ncbi:MAG: putative membrane protein YdjX (TVP38/TMEM64 family), partial [Alphaproteobacteria bacterium]